MNTPQDRQNFVRSVKLAIPLTPQDRKDFVRSVELAIPPTPPSVEGGAVIADQADDEETASVVDSSAISFVGNLSAQQKAGVPHLLFCMTLALIPHCLCRPVRRD